MITIKTIDKFIYNSTQKALLTISLSTHPALISVLSENMADSVTLA
jgi:hypothetical protein